MIVRWAEARCDILRDLRLCPVVVSFCTWLARVDKSLIRPKAAQIVGLDSSNHDRNRVPSGSWI